MEDPATYKPSDTYATAKLFVAWWAAEVADRLPDGMTVNAVSPGSTPDTNAVRNAPFYMRYIMLPVFKLVPGMSHSVDDGAGRYLEAANFGPDVSGKFFASKPKKMTGAITEIQMDHLDNPAAQQALWDVVACLAHDAGSHMDGKARYVVPLELDLTDVDAGAGVQPLGCQRVEDPASGLSAPGRPPADGGAGSKRQRADRVGPCPSGTA